jgi:hypothetical protein
MLCHPERSEGSPADLSPISSNPLGFFGRGAKAPLGQNDMIILMLGTPVEM